jgi:hypothetical protein
MNRLTRTAAGLAVAIVAAAGLSGCSDQRLGTAAVVDGQRISINELQQATRDYLHVVPAANSGDSQRAILQRLILSAVIAKAARTAGVHATAGAVARERDALVKRIGGRTSLVRALAGAQQPTVLAPEFVDAWFRDRLLYTRLATKLAGTADPTSTAAINRTTNALSKAARSMVIEVNPRYGHWDARTGVTPLVSGGLSKTAAELNPSS